MEEYSKNLEEHQSVEELFDSHELPSLEELIEEFSVEEMPHESFFEDDSDILLESELSHSLSDETAILLANDSDDVFEDQSARIVALENELMQARNNLWLIEQEKQEWQAIAERVQNDLEKFRWRVERERTEHYTYAIISVVREFLPILDNFERALSTAESSYNSDKTESAHFLNGIRLIYQQTHKLLTNLGIESIEAVGEHFNPQLHEAVAIEPSRTFPADTVIEQVLRGFRMGDKLIRPAVVKVSSSQTEDKQS